MVTHATRPAQASGYITEVIYPDHFHREVMPVWLASTLEAVGRNPPDIAKPYVWLDLGCGTGISTLVAAATNPKGRFIGVDFNADEIAQARGLAELAGVSNATFVHASFDQLSADGGADLPPCDFIVAHGVYSWVGAGVRRAIHEIVRRALRPGGVFYVSYITHPGAASFGAAQRMLRLLAQDAPGTPAQKVEHGVAWLKRMADHGAGYFSEHESARREVARLDAMDPAYLAHEFLNADWEAFHVGDVMAGMHEAGCDYAGSASLLENIDALSIPGKMAPVMADMHRAGWDAARLETARDIARNQNQRRDIYQKRGAPGTPLSADAHRRALLRQKVALLPQAPSADELRAQPGHAELSFETRIGPVGIAAPFVLPLLRGLQDGPRSYAELASLAEYRRNPGMVSQLLQALAWMGWTHFLRPDAGDACAAGVHARLTEQLEKRRRDPAMPAYLAAPAIGSAIPATEPGATSAEQRLSRLGL